MSSQLNFEVFFSNCRPAQIVSFRNSHFFNAETYADINGELCLRFRKIIYAIFPKYIITYFYLLFILFLIERVESTVVMTALLAGTEGGS